MAPAFALDFCIAPAVTLDTQLTIYYFVVLDIMIHILNEAMSWFHLIKSDCYVRRALLSLVHVLHLVLYSIGARGCVIIYKTAGCINCWEKLALTMVSALGRISLGQQSFLLE